MSMKLRKNLGRIATAFVATAMLASLSAVPASAAESFPTETLTPAQGQTGVSHGDTFNIAKYLKVPENANTPAHTYTFKIEAATNLTAAEEEKGIELGVEGGVPATADITFAANAEVDAEGYAKAKTNDLAVNIGEDGITHAGSYKYIVTEVSTAADGATQVYDDVKYDGNELILYVHVKNNETDPASLSVDFVELVDPDGDKTDPSAPTAAKIDGFTNEYGKDNDDNDKLHDITLIKEIEGDQANMNAKFAFSVSVVSQYGNDTVLIVDTNGNGEWGDTVGEGDDAVQDEVYTLKADGTAQTIYLGDGEQAKIFNLTEDSSYTIVENDANKNGYKTSVSTDDGEVPTNGTVSAEKVSKDLTITYINTKTSVTPTGIVMNVAPYALLVVVAAGACFVFLRKRRED